MELSPSRNSTDEAKQSEITNYFPVISYPDYCKQIHKASKIAELESTVNKLDSDNKKLLKKVERLKSKNKKVKSKLNSDKQKAEPSIQNQGKSPTTSKYNKGNTKPVRVTATTKTCIDHIITNRPVCVLDSGVLPCGISDHDAVFMVKNMRAPKPKLPPQSLSVRNYKKN